MTLAAGTINGTTVPSWPEVALSVLLVLAAAAVILRTRLGMTRELVVAVVRAAVQLLAVGALLGLIFDHAGVPGSLAWIAAMVLVAGRVAGGRGRGLPRSMYVATAAVAAGVLTTLGTLVAVGTVSTKPTVLLPIGGMIVNGAMQGTSLVLARLRDEVTDGRRAVEARLALGLPAGQAFAPHERRAMRAALIAPIDQTKVVGLISLPGAMTGLIIAGVSPTLAIRYQIVVMYMLLGAWAVGSLVATRLMRTTLFDEAHRLRPLESLRSVA
ncbi:MAG: UDP-glucose/iron transport system permease protein [Frankiales bacterium]|jgi:putative ABC transport system permease protein|nr:UDP-glucose/iron transport system permease protein [Frankiales bacterium]